MRATTPATRDAAQPDRRPDAVERGEVGDLDRAHAPFRRCCAGSAPSRPFDAVDGARLQIGQHRRPVVGRAISQPHRHPGRRDRSRPRAASPARRSALGGRRNSWLKDLVEPAHAAKPGGHRDLGHRQARFVNQLLGEQHAPGLRHRHRRRAEVLQEETAQLPLAHAQPLRQRLDARPPRRRARPRRSAPARATPCSTSRATTPARAPFRAGSAGTGGIPLPARPRPTERTGNSRACAGRAGHTGRQ